MNWLALYAPLLANASGGEVPLDMLLGHVQVESGGRPNERTSLDERGLMQIHPATSREMGFDHSRMFDPAYSIWAGVEMFRRMADKLQREFATAFPHGRDDFFWRIVRFEFATGSGALRKILAAMKLEGFQASTWDQFKGYLTRNRAALLRATKHDPVKWADNVDRVFATGSRLAQTGVVVAGSAGIAFILIGAGILLLLWKRNEEAEGETRHEAAA